MGPRRHRHLVDPILRQEKTRGALRAQRVGDHLSSFESYWLFTRSGGELLSHVLRRSTIAAAALNFRVREGTGCFARAMATKPRKKPTSRIARRAPGSVFCEAKGALAHSDVPGETVTMSPLSFWSISTFCPSRVRLCCVCFLV